MKKPIRLLALGLSLALGLGLAACGEKQGAQPSTSPDAVSSASENHYQESSFDLERLLQSVKSFEGACTIATVNADGTPNLSVAIPGAVGECIYFYWADNTTKANLLRDGTAVVSWYLYHPEAENDAEKYQGARMVVSPITDEEELKKAAPDLSAAATVLRIDELLPIG